VCVRGRFKQAGWSVSKAIASVETDLFKGVSLDDKFD
jgi:hypothetical protein